MSGRLKDGGGILDGGISAMVYALNAAGIPTVPADDWTQAIAWVASVDQGEAEHPVQSVTLTQSIDWAEPGGNEDDLSLVIGAIYTAFDTAHLHWLHYWGPDAGTTLQNVIATEGAFITLSAGWPASA